MRTSFPDLFGALAAPIPPDQVKTKTGKGGSQQRFITARVVMNRLDSAAGPENWWARFFEVAGVLFCEIVIRLPDGREVGKTDAGGFTTMLADRRTGEVDDKSTKKSGASDAFKRAAVHWGIGRELYRDGTAVDEDDRPRERERDRERPRRDEPPPPANGNGKPSNFPKSWEEALKRAVGKWLDFEPVGPEKVDKERTAREHRIAHHLVSLAISRNVVAEAKVSTVNPKGEVVRDPKEVWGCVKWLWDFEPQRVVADLADYLKEKQAEAAAKTSGGKPAAVPQAEALAGTPFANWINRQVAGHARPAEEILTVAVNWGARQGFFDDPFYMKGDSFELPDDELLRLAAIAHARDAKGLTKEVGSALRADARAPEAAAAEGGNRG